MIVSAKVSIRGVRPVLWHVFTVGALEKDGRKEKSGSAGNNPEEWKQTVLYKQETRQLYVPATYIQSALINAARYTKEGRGSIQNKLAGTLQIKDLVLYVNRYLPEELETNNYDLPVYLDVRGVVNPSTKGRNVRYRVAASPGWELEFTMLYDNTVVSENQVKSVIKDAGDLVGLGDGRRIGFGRFERTAFESV